MQDEPKIDEQDFARFQAIEAGATAPPTTEQEHPSDDKPEGESPEPEQGETKPEEQSPKVDVELLARSTQALKRYGMTAAWLNKHTDEEIIGAGAHLLKIQEDNDRAQSELKTLKLGKEKPAGDVKTPATPAADLSKLNKKLADKLGIEEADAPLLAELVGEVVKPYIARIEAMEAREGQGRIQSAIREVSQTYDFDPKDAATVERLVEKAQKISGGYDNELDCLLDAARILGIKTRSEAEAAAKASAQVAENGRKQNGLPARNGRAAPASAKSWEELELEAMVALEDGDRDKGNRLLALSRAARAG